MALRSRRKPAAAPRAAQIVADDADPQSWLYLNPAGPSPAGLVFGVLRKSYAGRINSAAEFGWRKAHPVPPSGGADPSLWQPTAERVEVLLPTGAEDGLADPMTLLAQMDLHALDREKALLVYLTLPVGDVDRIHDGWERARAFVRDGFARDRGLAAMLALHAPGRIGSSHPLHAHVLVVPRRAGGLGIAHGAYDEELIRDGGQAIVEAMWAVHREEFR